MTQAIRAMAVVALLACAAVSNRGQACGPPPTLRQYVASAEPILLVQAVGRSPVPAEECTCGCESQVRMTFDVLESWTGDGPRTLVMDLYSGPDEPRPAILLVGTFNREQGASTRHFPIHAFEDRDDPAVGVMREAVGRAVVLARHGETPDPGLLRVHIVESLLQAATRVDGLNEASRLAWAREPTPFVLNDQEAEAVAAAAVRDDLKGWELAQVVALLQEAPSPELRALVLKRVDEAVGSEEPEYLVDLYLRALGLECQPLLDIEDEDGVEGEALPGALPVDGLEYEEPTVEEMRRWQEEADRLAATEKQRWSEFREAWPALRKTLVR
jgi:hypothetical protein